MIFEYDELKEYVKKDFEDFYKMGFDKEQIFYAVLDEYKHGEDFCQVENICIHVFLILNYLENKLDFNIIIEKLNLLITKETENEMKYELENEYTKYIADLNFIKEMLAKNSKYFIPEIPSKREELLKQVINSKVKKMIRYALDPIEEYLDEYELKPTMVNSEAIS